jgi:hypothetical protein
VPDETVTVTLPTHARDYLVDLLKRIDNEPEADYILNPRGGPTQDAYRAFVRATLASA